MGSSLRVTPAADIPLETARRGGNLVICNLQKTPLDDAATLCIYAKCDDIMKILMEKLGYLIPKWQMKKRVEVELTDEGKKVKVQGVDSNGAPFHLFKSVEIVGLSASRLNFPSTKQTKQPYSAAVSALTSGKKFQMKLEFQRHYAEPDLTFSVEMNDLIEHGKVQYEMVFGAADTGNWELILKKGVEDVFGVVDDAHFTQGSRPKSDASK